MPEKYLANLCQLLSQQNDKNTLRDEFLNFSQVDWENLISLAEEYRLLPLTYTHLKKLGVSDRLPAAGREKMRQAVLTNATRNTLFLHEAKIVLETLKGAHIPVIGLKGVYLLDNIYPDISTRTMNDLDLMVKKRDIPAAISICQSLGYQPTTYFNIHDANLDIKHVPPLKKETGPYLELHWTILEEDEPFTIDAKGLWERALPAKIAGSDALTLSPEDLILHLCLHLAYQHHLSLGLRGLYDVTAVLHHFKGGLDGSKMAASAHTWGSTRVLGLSLTLAEDLLGAPIPLEVWDHLPPNTLEPWAVEEARLQLLDRGHPAVAMTPDLAKFAQEQGVFKRIQHIWKRIFLPKVTLARLYNVPPTSLRIYGCYVKRAWDLFTHYRSSMAHILERDEGVQATAEKEQATQRLRSWMGKG